MIEPTHTLGNSNSINRARKKEVESNRENSENEKENIEKLEIFYLCRLNFNFFVDFLDRHQPSNKLAPYF